MSGLAAMPRSASRSFVSMLLVTGNSGRDVGLRLEVVRSGTDTAGAWIVVEVEFELTSLRVSNAEEVGA